MVNKKELTKRIEDVVANAIAIINKNEFKEGLVETDELGLENAHPATMSLLSLVQIIRTVQGTSRIYIGKGIKSKNQAVQKIDMVKKVLINITEHLSNSNNHNLAKKDIICIFSDNDVEDSKYNDYIKILSLLNIATSTGRGKYGGIKLYDKETEKQGINEVEKFIENAEGKKKEKLKKRHEPDLYPAAAKFVTSLGYAAIILGGVRVVKGKGNWNTPDIVGYNIVDYSVLGGADLEIISVEVKWDLTKYAIAEANSHQRLAHKTFIMVKQKYNDIRKSLIEELIHKGLGLICSDIDEYRIVLPPKRNIIDKTELNEFLEIVLDEKDVKSIKEQIATYYYKHYHQPLMPK